MLGLGWQQQTVPEHTVTKILIQNPAHDGSVVSLEAPTWAALSGPTAACVPSTGCLPDTVMGTTALAAAGVALMLLLRLRVPHAVTHTVVSELTVLCLYRNTMAFL